MKGALVPLLATIGCWTAPVAVAPPEPAPVHAAPLPTSIARLEQLFAPTSDVALDGTVEGLVAPTATPWGIVGPLAWMYDVGSEPTRPDNARYRFSLDGHAWRYLAIDAAPGDHADEHAPGFVLTTPTGPYLHPIVDAYPWRRNRLGLAGSLHLVRVRVDGGAGAASASTWIAASAIEILDGTKAFPARLDPAAAHARATFEGMVAAREAPALAHAWRHVRDAFPPDTKPANLYEIGSIEIAYLRWDRTRRVATIGFARVVTGQKLSYAAGAFARTLYASPPPPKLNAHYGVLFVGETEVDAAGATHDRMFAPTEFWSMSCYASRCGGDPARWPELIPRR